jgi:hypothetical protein
MHVSYVHAQKTAPLPASRQRPFVPVVHWLSLVHVEMPPDELLSKQVPPGAGVEH